MRFGTQDTNNTNMGVRCTVDLVLSKVTTESFGTLIQISPSCSSETAGHRAKSILKVGHLEHIYGLPCSIQSCKGLAVTRKWLVVEVTLVKY